MSSSAQTVITKYHRLGGSNNLFPHGSGGWIVQDSTAGGVWFPGRNSLPVLMTATYLLTSSSWGLSSVITRKEKWGKESPILIRSLIPSRVPCTPPQFSPSSPAHDLM